MTNRDFSDRLGAISKTNKYHKITTRSGEVDSSSIWQKMIRFRQGKATRLAGYSSKSADSRAVENLKNPQIIEYIEELNKASRD